jgi:AbrB family looped-hinge helix DNA binding protein
MASFRTRIGPSGRLVIPAPCRKELGLTAGDEVVLKIEDDELKISTLKHCVERVQALVRRHNRKGEKLSASLIRERRRQAATE